MSGRILITGHRGYVGSVLAPRWAARGHDILGVDAGYFNDCSLLADTSGLPSLVKDIRHLTEKDLAGCEAVVHLAALSNDPLGNLNPKWTEAINVEATIRLAELARSAGVERFLFSSSCIVYGEAAGEWVDEDSPVDPRTDYARSKLTAEKELTRLAGGGFSPVFLRNGTIYGVSPRMRFDTVLNSLAGGAVAAEVIRVFSDGAPWRPLVHVEDVADAFEAALRAPREIVCNQVLNVGHDDVNQTVRQLAEQVRATVPGARLEIEARPEADQRSYRTRFRKIEQLLPGFRLRWRPDAGIRRLVTELQALRLSSANFADPQFVRLSRLRELLDAGRLDDQLFWSQKERAA